MVYICLLVVFHRYLDTVLLKIVCSSNVNVLIINKNGMERKLCINKLILTSLICENVIEKY
jgi:hypothetical protein